MLDPRRAGVPAVRRWKGGGRGVPFVKATARRICRCFAVRRRRGGAEPDRGLNGWRMGRYFVGTIVLDDEDACVWHLWESDGEGLRDFSEISNIPAQGIRNRPKDEAHRSSFGLCLLSCIVCIAFCRPYGMPGILMGKRGDGLCPAHPARRPSKTTAALPNRGGRPALRRRPYWSTGDGRLRWRSWPGSSS